MFRRRILAIGASVLMLVAGIAIVIAALAGLGGKKNYSLPSPKQSFSETQAVTPTPEQVPTAVPSPTPEPSSAPVARLSIAKIKVDADIEILGLDQNNAMQDPKGFFDVAWYDLGPTSRPGWGGNAVFAGHVDCATCRSGGPGAAVFWDLKNLEPNDQINVSLADGVRYTYRVTALFQVIARDDGTFDTSLGTVVSINDLVGPTEKESVTLITCGGTFNPRTHQYDKRLIVRAERQADPSAESNQ